ncbi:hypothetical protein DBR11_07110 [Pedobacter sp. HMWF019]|uniref:DUF481 domain-containing protein n=1 Tax=Pedobacter sp. HMWF019 TaxID=2056856 RepID=UPI000D358645|nr:DUF481 domain-containing protein [Pedobacter sp. HMWF019]PTT01517.1 hypothetical protein DBR11_07110 [Pedobacter sp. HMWF019]
MYKLFLCFIFLFTTFVCNAQFSDSTNYYVNYTSTGSLNTTNDNRSYLLNNAVKLNIRKKGMSLNFNNNWVYGQQDRELTNNDFSSSLDFNLYKNASHFFYWGLTNYNTSKSLKVNNQLLAGAGVAYSIYDRENAYLNLSNGILFDSSDLIVDDAPDVYHTYRNSLRVTFKFIIRKVIILNSSTYYQVSLKQGDDYIFKTNNSLSLKLNKWLSFTTAYNFNRVSRTDRQNSLLSYGLTFERYF